MCKYGIWVGSFRKIGFSFFKKIIMENWFTIIILLKVVNNKYIMFNL